MRRDAFGQGVAVAAVGAEDGVVGAQMGAYAGGNGLLADVGVAGTHDHPGLVGAGQLLLAAPDHQHFAVEREVDFARIG